VKTIRAILKTATFKQSSLTFGATLVNGFLGMAFFIIVARALGPSEYGLFSVIIAALTLTADIGDLGTDTGIVRFVARFIKTKPKKAYRFLKFGLKVKLAVTFLLMLLGWVAAPWLARTVFNKPELTLGLRIGFMGTGSALLFSFSTHALQGLQNFRAWSLLFVGTNMVRLLMILTFVYVGKLSSVGAVGVYIIMPLIGFAVSLYVLPHNFLKVKNENIIAREFFRYNRWVALFTLIAAVSARLDIFMSARLLTNEQVGYYSAAAQLGQVFPQLVTALGTVIAPKMAEMDKNNFLSYLKKTQLMVVFIALLGLASIPVGAIFIPIFYGSAYTAAVPIFSILVLGMLIFLISVPVHNAIFYYYSYPKLFVWLAIGNIIIIAVFGWNLILHFGATGAALAVLVGNVFNLVIPAIWVMYQLKKNK